MRDVQIMIGRTVYTTAADGIVDVPNARGTVHVTYIGYSVTPALQQVAFRTWSDGVTASSRDVDADGRGHLGLAIDLRYRVTVAVPAGSKPGPAKVTASSPLGSVQFTNGSPQWVIAERGERTGAAVVARTITYSFKPAAGAPAGRRQEFTASPEALWVVRV